MNFQVVECDMKVVCGVLHFVATVRAPSEGGAVRFGSSRSHELENLFEIPRIVSKGPGAVPGIALMMVARVAQDIAGTSGLDAVELADEFAKRLGLFEDSKVRALEARSESLESELAVALRDRDQAQGEVDRLGDRLRSLTDQLDAEMECAREGWQAAEELRRKLQDSESERQELSEKLDGVAHDLGSLKFANSLKDRVRRTTRKMLEESNENLLSLAWIAERYLELLSEEGGESECRFARHALEASIAYVRDRNGVE